jgi:hypothetical protein
MSEVEKPVPPSVEDVKLQIRKAIEDKHGKGRKAKGAKAKAPTARLIARIKKLNNDLQKQKDPDKQKELLGKLQELVGENHKSGAELGPDDNEYEKEIKQLNSDIEGMNDLGD